MKIFIILLIFLMNIDFAKSDIKECIEFLAKRDQERSIDCINDEIKKSPKNDILYFIKGTIYTTFNDATSAIDSFSKALELNPKNLGAYTSRANIYLYKGSYNNAISDLSMAVNLDKKESKIFSASLLSQRGGTYQRMKLFKNANIDYKKALSIFNDMSNIEWDEVKKKNEKYDMKQGLYLDVYLGLCSCDISLKNFAESLNYCKKAQDLDKESIIPKVNLASVYIELRQYLNAINTLNQIPKDKFETSFMANYNFTIVNLRLFEDTKDVKYEKQFKQSLLLTKQLAQNKEQIEIFNNFSLKLQKKN